MSVTDYDLAGFAVGVVERSAMLGRERVEAGDQIIGLASNGLHSNGYSLVRKAWTDKLTNQQLIEDRLADGSTVADAVLAPTRIYVQSLLAAYQKRVSQAAALTAQAGEAARPWPLAIKAAAHITGGGISENLNRSLPADCNALVDLDSWPVPEVIKAAIAAANLSLPEALKTFNMGIGMAVIVAPDDLQAMLAHFSREQKAYHIGSVVAADDTASGGQVIYSPTPAGQTSFE
jgi:phosphoribosylformylglycinamidine cyclo-ligase